MIKFNNKAKKVKKVQETKDYDNALISAGFLFWGEREVDVDNGDLKYSYLQRECFIGNSDNKLAAETTGCSFVMKKITGDPADGFFRPVQDGDEFFITPRTNDGKLEDYKIILEPFTLNGKIDSAFRLKDIKKVAKEFNEKSENDAMYQAILSQDCDLTK